MKLLDRSALWLLPIILLVIALGVFVAGCGGGGPSDSERSAGTKGFKAIVITYNGRPLHCIERAGSGGLDTTSGQYSGLTCDWVAYHQDGAQ